MSYDLASEVHDAAPRSLVPCPLPAAANETVAEFCGYPADTPGPQWPAEPLDFVGELQYANITEASVGYYRFGNTSGLRPPLVMVVGFAQTMGDWNASLMEELARDQEVIVFDNRGMGESKVQRLGWKGVEGVWPVGSAWRRAGRSRDPLLFGGHYLGEFEIREVCGGM